MRYTDLLKQETKGTWEKILTHPFVTGIGDGTLPTANYKFYLKQDYLYLLDFSKLLALAVAKAKKESDMSFFSSLLAVTLNTEMDLHRKTCRDFGIENSELLATTPHLITASYTSFLLKTAYEGTFEEILAALLPCAVGYYDIARNLIDKKYQPAQPYYREWIDMYSNDGYHNLVVQLEDIMNKIVDENGAGAKLFDIYRISAQFELLFFDMSMHRDFL